MFRSIITPKGFNLNNHPDYYYWGGNSIKNLSVPEGGQQKHRPEEKRKRGMRAWVPKQKTLR